MAMRSHLRRALDRVAGEAVRRAGGASLRARTAGNAVPGGAPYSDGKLINEDGTRVFLVGISNLGDENEVLS
jgi:hypothetical protein